VDHLETLLNEKRKKIKSVFLVFKKIVFLKNLVLKIMSSFGLGLPAYMDSIANGEIQEVALSSRGIDTDHCRLLAAALSRAQKAPRVVDLNDNGINDDGLEMIVDALRNNKNVLELHLMNNVISNQGAEFLLRMLQDGSNIRTLALGGNKISDNLLKQIEETCVINTQPVPFRRVAAFLRANDPRGDVLEIFDDNSFSLALFKSALAGNNQLKVLRLVGCQLSDGGAGALAEIIPGRQGLEVLDISRNGITSHGLRHLIDALAKNNSIKSLLLNGNRLTDDATRAMIEMLKTNNSIQVIEVADNAISEAAQQRLRHAVSLNCEPLELKQGYYAAQINDPAMDDFRFQWVKDTSRGAAILAPVLKNNTTVKKLNLSNSRMGDAGLRALLPVLQSNKTLQTLEIANCNITSTALEEMCKVLANSNNTLREINLANNKICNKGAKALSNALLSNYSLHLINLELNEVSAEAMAEIEGLLAINRQPRALKAVVPLAEADSNRLTSIDFSKFDGEQYHGSETARILALSLRGNTNVKTVNLSGNPIGDDGGAWIGKLIAANAGVETIILEDCAIGDRGAIAIASALAKNTRLNKLVLRDNHLGNSAGEALLNFLGEPNDTLHFVDVTKTRILPELRECIEAAAALNTQPGQLKRILPQLEEQSPTRTRALPGTGAVANTERSVVTKHREISFRRTDKDSKPLTDVALQMLCTQLAEDTTVQYLDLSGNALTAVGIKHLAKWLARPNSRIEALNLATNPDLKDEAIVLLALEGFAKNKSLKEVNLVGTNFTSKGLQAIVHSLKTNDTIVSIEYDETPDMSRVLRTEFVRELALNTQNIEVKRLTERIVSNDATLTVLDLADKHVGDTSVKLLSLALVHNTNITAVDLSNNDLSSEGIQYFGDLLEDNKTINTISLARNNIDDAGAQFLIRVLAINNTVRDLDISENPNIDESLVEQLGYSIRVNNGPSGFKRVMTALIGNSESLRTYNGNGKNETIKYDDESVYVLCPLLIANTVVTKLDLSNNNVGDLGCQFLSDVLRINRTITSIDLSRNKITAAGVEALFNALKFNSTVTEINLEGNPAPRSVIEVLDGPLNVNKTPLRTPSISRGLPSARPHVADAEFDILRDIDFLNAVDEAILEDAYRGCPNKEKIREIFETRQKMLKMIQESQQKEEIKSLTWNRDVSRKIESREKEFADSVSPLRRMLTDQKRSMATDPIDDEL
jgi:Ran GTPase-activating protein (RanGAP) involved in mRNA processing and transport